MKKTTFIWAITLVIAGLMITSAVSIPAERSEEKSLVRELDLEVAYLTAKATKIDMTEKKSDNVASIYDSTIIYDSEYDDFHPTVAGDSSGRFFAGFELTMDETDYYPDFWYSLDGGETWTEAGYFTISLNAQYPDADSNEVGFYGTFAAPPDTPAVTMLVDASDLTAITGYSVDWSAHGITDFVYVPGISCYTFEGEESWNHGGSAKTCYNNYNGADIVDCPVINYPMPGDSVAIGWLTGAPRCINADFAIDEMTDYSYAVYDSSDDPNLLVRKDNFAVRNADGFHSNIGSYSVGAGDDLQNPSIDINDNIGVIVAEAVGDVVCFYTSNGFGAVQQSTVEAGAAHPEVMLAPDGTFVCSYIKDGVLYSEKSVDGATWDSQEQIADSEVNDGLQTHDLAKGVDGVYGVWEDIRSADIDIFFAKVTGVEVPILDIISIEGGIGVTATIKNIGTGAATDVELSLTVTGGILGFINKNASATVASLAIDEETTISSGIIFGLGAVDIVVTATCAEGSTDEETVDGTQIIIFTRI